MMKVKKKWLILTVIGIMTFMGTIDSSIVNVALPVINRELQINMGLSEMVVSVYLITVCDFLLLFGNLGDRYGKRRLFKWGLMIFTFGSLFCGLSRNITWLLIARFIQATGTALTMSSNNGIVTEVFGDQKGQALGWMGLCTALGMIAGPSLGGLLLAKFDWDSIFLINVPIGLLIGLVGLKILGTDQRTSQSSFADYLGTTLYILGMTGLFIYIYGGQQLGFSNKYLIIEVIVSLLLLALFIRREKQITQPLLDLSLLKNRAFTLGLFSAIMIFITNSFYMVFTPFYLQNARGLSATTTGLLMTFLPLGMIFAPIAGRLSDRYGTWKISLAGLVLTTVVQLAFSLVNLHTPISLYTVYIVTLGLASALFQSPNNSMIMGAVNQKQLGIAGSMNNLAKYLGISGGNAIGTSLLFIVMSSCAHQRINNFTGHFKSYYILGQGLTYGLGVLLLVTTIVLYFNSKKLVKN